MRKLSIITIITVVAFALTFAALGAGKKDEQALIKLDNEWGGAGTDTAAIAAILADDLISVDGDGVVGKKEVLDAGPGPGGPEPYKAGDFKVKFLDDDTAIMVHSVAGDAPHWSMHVWAKRDGRWQVVASSSTPASD